MTTGFGFCSSCGTPRIAAEQRFCAGCGADLSVNVALAPPAAAVELPAVETTPLAAPEPPAPLPASEPIAPPAWSTPFAPEPVAEPPAPPAWSIPPDGAPPAPPAPPAWSVPTDGAQVAPPQWAAPQAASGAPAAPPAPPYPPAYPGAPAAYYPGAAPAASGKPIATVAGIDVTPKLLGIGGIVLAVVVVALIYLGMSSRSGSIVFSPSTISCSAATSVTETVTLPSSLSYADQISLKLDGVAEAPTTVGGSGFVQQTDGTWTNTSPLSTSDVCSLASSGSISMGTHTLQVVDASGKVLAEGKYTLTP